VKLKDIITRETWQQAVADVTEDLPEDVQASVGYRSRSPEFMLVTVAVEPFEADHEAEVRELELRWWRTMREQMDALIEEEARELEPRRQGRDVPADEMACARLLPGCYPTSDPRWQLPVLEISGGCENLVESVVPGRATVGTLREVLQRVVLEEMWGGGGVSMVSKDHKGRFIREDGSHILAWQFKRRRRA
jgi:hypothetical protein